MPNNIFLFTGEASYLLDKELYRRTDGFVQKFGQDALFRYSAANFDAAEILQSLQGGGLFASKKMIIIKGLPIDTYTSNKLRTTIAQPLIDEILERGSTLGDDILLVFVSYKPDKRAKLYKFLKENAQIKEFNPLKTPGLKKFIREESPLSLSDEVIDYFLVKVGNDLYRVVHELQKLHRWSLANDSDAITADVVDHVVFGQVETNAFAFFDHLFDNPKRAIGVLDEMEQEGADWNQAAGMLYRGLKLYLFMVDVYQQGITDSKQIASTLKMHPFAVAKNKGKIDTLIARYHPLQQMYKKIITLDVAIKSGKLPDTSFWLETKKMVYHFDTV